LVDQSAGHFRRALEMTSQEGWDVLCWWWKLRI
jgi:hypothetical protein